uniref:CSON011773 protein n=1 Tax=Culicoides sonorensis TaxID=179676 RepID=A0A336KNQ0_CULSO
MFSSSNKMNINEKDNRHYEKTQKQENAFIVNHYAGKANPFFIRCIKSNINKLPNMFDESTVARQLKYTGMLETVRIRRAGYNVRISYLEFKQLYRVLLPKGIYSNKLDIHSYLILIDLNKQHYQLGKTKIYMRESQKVQLDIKLHTKIIISIRKIQKWFRRILKKKKCLKLNQSALTIQNAWKQHVIKKKEFHAALLIQSYWKMYKIRKWYFQLINGCKLLQCHIRGYNTRLAYTGGIYKIRTTIMTQTNTKLNRLRQSNDLDKYIQEEKYPSSIIQSTTKTLSEINKSRKSKFSTTREYTDSTDRIISDAKELRLMQDFITKKIYKMDTKEVKFSEVDMVFKQALKEFNENLVAQYSVANKQDSGVLNIKYRDLIANFERVIETTAISKNGFPLTMGVNAFRGFMNEFMSSRDHVMRIKKKNEKKKKKTNLIVYNALKCNKISLRANEQQKLFGVPLSLLCHYDEGKCTLPQQLEELFCKIEIHGLYSEGLYRKSAVSSKIRDFKEKLENGLKNIDVQVYSVHVLANTLKLFLREMPEPLLTFDLYDDFLRAAELVDNNDRIQTIILLTKNLQSSHQILFERLIFHLALVANKQQYNRMSTSSLAIVFAPCILRTNRCIPAQDSLNDIGRQTKCIEAIIMQKIQNIKNTLNNIDSLDVATNTASERLNILRGSKFLSDENKDSAASITSNAEELLLEDHIEELIKEKTQLTLNLPTLVRINSDEDLLSTEFDYDNESSDEFKESYKKCGRNINNGSANPTYQNENNLRTTNCEFGYCIDKVEN